MTDSAPRSAALRWPRWLLPVLAGVAVVGLAAGFLVPRLLAGAGTVTVHGVVHLMGQDNLGGSDLHCLGAGGYSDLHPGTAVVITDAAGTTVAVTSLQNGEFDISTTPLSCAWPFEATVPGGKGFYGFEVSHRGRVQYPEAQLGGVRLQIGP